MSISFILFLGTNALLLFFAWQTVKNYRVLSKWLGDVERDKSDVMSIGFLEKIFHAKREQPSIRKIQKAVIRHASLTALLMVLSRYLFISA